MSAIENPIKTKTGFIYKMFSPNVPCESYVGYTSRTIHRRLVEHKSKIITTNIKLCFKNEIDSLKIDVLEEFEYSDKKDILYRERYWYEKLRPTLNKCYPIRSRKEYDHLYYKQHRLELLEKRKIRDVCEICGDSITKRHINRHQKSKRCLKKQNNIVIDI